MLTREQRAAAGASWLSLWQAWQASGLSGAAFARRERFDPRAAYRWKWILRRTGQWIEGTAKTPVARPTRRKRNLRLTLGNGRLAELEVSGVAPFAELMGALERAA